MRYLVYATILGGLALANGLVRGSGTRADDLARTAVSTDRAAAQHAIARLRAEGPAGLQRLWDAHRASIEAHRVGGASCGLPDRSGAWSRIRAALDGVGGQRDCYSSKLFWYTDLDEAQAAAQASGKPILSLRMLGKLTDEYSCANSRFFRTALYANAEISAVLRRDYILHWQSVRRVPVLTVDFGDGRVLRRTITGNSIHYVLDPQGRIVDALPGLYGPQAFLQTLGKAHAAAVETTGLVDGTRQEVLASFYRQRIDEIDMAASTKGGIESAPVIASSATLADNLVGSSRDHWGAGTSLGNVGNSDRPGISSTDSQLFPATWSFTRPMTDEFGTKPLDRELTQVQRVPLQPPQPLARRAMNQTTSKSVVEMSYLRVVEDAAKNRELVISWPDASRQPAVTLDQPDRNVSNTIADFPTLEEQRKNWSASFSPNSAIRRLPPLRQPGPFVENRPATLLGDERLTELAQLRVADSKLDAASAALLRAKQPESLTTSAEGMIAQFERDMAMDTARNEYVFHRQLYGWLLSGADRPGLDALNARVYAELFLTPLSDPWMGLANPGVYTALEGDGRIEPREAMEFARLAE